MKNTIIKFCIALLTAFSFASCNEKPSYIPNYNLEDLWAAVNSQGKTNTLYEFKNGHVYILESTRKAKYTVSNNEVIGCSESVFKNTDVYPYCIKGEFVLYGEEFENNLGHLESRLEDDAKSGEYCMETNDGLILVRVDGFSNKDDGQDEDDENNDDGGDSGDDDGGNPGDDGSGDSGNDDGSNNEDGDYIELTASEWGMVGTFNNWGSNGDPDIVMYDYEDWYVAIEVYLTTEDEFKFRTNNDWTNHLAIDYSYPVKYGYSYYLVDGSIGQNIKVAETGYYNVWIEKDLSYVHFLEAE